MSAVVTTQLCTTLDRMFLDNRTPRRVEYAKRQGLLMVRGLIVTVEIRETSLPFPHPSQSNFCATTRIVSITRGFCLQYL